MYMHIKVVLPCGIGKSGGIDFWDTAFAKMAFRCCPAGCDSAFS